MPYRVQEQSTLGPADTPGRETLRVVTVSVLSVYDKCLHLNPTRKRQSSR